RRRACGPVRRDLHRGRWRPVGPGRRSTSRYLEGADLLRAGSARRSEKGRLPYPRLPRGRAQEVRPRQGAQIVPVLEALIASLEFTAKAVRAKGARFLAPFLCVFVDELMQFFLKTCA